jgi:hypothetical protein
VSAPQHEVALAHAQRVRRARAVIRGELRSAHSKEAALELAAQHVEDPVAELATMPLLALIAAGHRCSDAVALRIVADAGVSANVCVGSTSEHRPGWLTDAQRQRVCEALCEMADSVRYNRRQPTRRPRPPRRTLRAVAEPEPEVQVVAEPEGQKRPSLSRWCPVCAQYAVPMTNGTCGFCDTQIEDRAA